LACLRHKFLLPTKSPTLKNLVSKPSRRTSSVSANVTYTNCQADFPNRCGLCPCTCLAGSRRSIATQLDIFQAGALSCPDTPFCSHAITFSTTFNTSCQPNVRLHISLQKPLRLFVEAAKFILPSEQFCFAEHYNFASMVTSEQQEPMLEAPIFP
jgi:hypothetical protein